MAIGLKLQIEFGSTAPFVFDVVGPIVPRLAPTFRRAFADQSGTTRQVETIPTQLEIEGRLVAASSSALWTAISALRALVEAAAQPTAITLRRDTTGGTGTGTAVWTFSSPTYEQIRIEEVRGLPTDELMPASSWTRSAVFTVVVTAVKKLVDAHGIVNWTQRVTRRADDSGLPEIQWELDVETAEGTSAVDKVRTFCLIPIDLLGGTYTYLTNDEFGVDVTYDDAHEEDGRTPTVAHGVCRVKGWGINVGTSQPGASPTRVSYDVTTKQDKDTVETVYLVSAIGPGAYSWVLGKRPDGVLAESEVTWRQATNEAVGRWVARTSSTTTNAQGVTRSYEVEITGGGAPIDFEPIVGGLPPVQFEQALAAWQVSVKVKLERQGGAGRRDELMMPGLLPETTGLILDRVASAEGEPFVSQFATDPSGNRWARVATLVYRSAGKPRLEASVREALEAQDPVESYLL